MAVGATRSCGLPLPESRAAPVLVDLARCQDPRPLARWRQELQHWEDVAMRCRVPQGFRTARAGFSGGAGSPVCSGQ